MNQYKLGQLGKVWSMMSRHPEVLLINIVRVVISSQLPGLFLSSEYFNQKPIKIGWVCRGGLFIVAFSKKVIWIWERGGKNRRGHQSPFSENYVKSTMNYIFISLFITCAYIIYTG